MFQWMDKFKKKPTPVAEEKPKSLADHYREKNAPTTHGAIFDSPEKALEIAVQRKAVADFVPTEGHTQDSMSGNNTSLWGAQSQYQVPIALLNWYGNQGFIGYQFCALLSQNWLIRKACAMPAKDAIRKGYMITKNDGGKLSPDVLNAFNKAAKKYKLKSRMREFVTFGRIYGIRVAVFQVASPDKEYYQKPFNIDGVRPGSYRGIAMADPYWITPLLDMDAVNNPDSQNFYEPTWWVVQGKMIHRSHCVIFRTEELPDVLKPTYYYGGIPLPQQIMERVYNSERTANEAPLLTMTKRLNIMKVDLAQAIANPVDVAARVTSAAQYRDNYGYYLIDREDEITQTDTTLADLDAVIMTQYQLVASVACVPATKLLGTTPKGFNSTGEYDEASYHEELETMQEHDITPLLDMHHKLVIKSDIAPEFGTEYFEVEVNWHSLDAMTAKEEAETNEIKARTDVHLADAGAIDGQDIRDRIINDLDSGYNGLSAEAPEVPELAGGENFFESEGNGEKEEERT